MIYFLHEYFIIVYYLLTEDHYLPRRFSETVIFRERATPDCYLFDLGCTLVIIPVPLYFKRDFIYMYVEYLVLFCRMPHFCCVRIKWYTHRANY